MNDEIKEKLYGWQMFNEGNETNATETQILSLLNEMSGKSTIERDVMLTAFVNKHKFIPIKSQ